jgi:hypothetical protein
MCKIPLDRQLFNTHIAKDNAFNIVIDLLRYFCNTKPLIHFYQYGQSQKVVKPTRSADTELKATSLTQIFTACTNSNANNARSQKKLIMPSIVKYIVTWAIA